MIDEGRRREEKGQSGGGRRGEERGEGTGKKERGGGEREYGTIREVCFKESSVMQEERMRQVGKDEVSPQGGKG